MTIYKQLLAATEAERNELQSLPIIRAAAMGEVSLEDYGHRTGTNPLRSLRKLRPDCGGALRG